MNYYIKERKFEDETAKTAWSKAREDAESICRAEGFSEIPVWPDLGDRVNASALAKLRMNLAMGRIWSGALAVLRPGDTVLIQLPVIHNCLFLGNILRKLKRKQVRVVGLVHDLEILRMSLDETVGIGSRVRILLEEKSVLRQCRRLIVHNGRMLDFLASKGIAPESMIPLEIFDYLMDSETEAALSEKEEDTERKRLIVAGNLSPNKAGYVYAMPDNAQANLYGVFYRDSGKGNLHYRGAFPPGELPAKLRGGFGLVWDGPSAEGCTGVYGAYLRYNNPHKTSLYLASGLPVVIWEEAAVAEFVRREAVGVTVGSLREAAEKIAGLSGEEYRILRENAREAGRRLRNGCYLKRALKAALRK